MSINYDNKNLDFIDDELIDDELIEDELIEDELIDEELIGDSKNYFENIIKIIFVTLYKLIKEICIFIFKTFYYIFTLIKKKINDNKKFTKKEINSQYNKGESQIFNKKLLENKQKFISNVNDIQDNSGINDILGINSNISIKNKNDKILSYKKNKICIIDDKTKNVKKNIYNISDICRKELGTNNNSYKNKNKTNTDIICELFKL
jgi:hypothetical protein